MALGRFLGLKTKSGIPKLLTIDAASALSNISYHISLFGMTPILKCRTEVFLDKVSFLFKEDNSDVYTAQLRHKLSTSLQLPVSNIQAV